MKKALSKRALADKKAAAAFREKQLQQFVDRLRKADDVEAAKAVLAGVAPDIQNEALWQAIRKDLRDIAMLEEQVLWTKDHAAMLFKARPAIMGGGNASDLPL